MELNYLRVDLTPDERIFIDQVIANIMATSDPIETSTLITTMTDRVTALYKAIDKTTADLQKLG